MRSKKTMFSSFTNLFSRNPHPPQNGLPLMREPSSGSPIRQSQNGQQKQSFAKVFRWRLPDGETKAPTSVEIVGSFTRWQRVTLHRDSVLDAWHATIHHIPGNRTHHYMLLIDGKPSYDKSCDG